MNRPVASCPGCGAPVRFRWADAVQTVCEHCGSILVRHDVDLERLGRVAAPPPLTSRIQLGTEGRYRGKAFTVVGRIAYEWSAGRWSEWHVLFSDGTTGWLSDAQDEYAVTFPLPGGGELPALPQLRPGTEIRLPGVGTPFQVSAVTRARYAGVEGDLPFTTWNRDEAAFVDLRSPDGRLATVDYSDPRPLLFAGEFVEFADLGLRELREIEDRRVEGTGTLNCPNCGGPITLRQPGQTVNAVCPACLTVLSVDESRHLGVLQRFADRVRVDPLIPLGSKGALHGAEWEVLGFQRRTIRVEGIAYSWGEYLLHSPERGFRYLTEYTGHWNDVVVLKSPPQTSSKVLTADVSFRGQGFRHFQRSTAETTFVLGEFPWQVRVGEKVEADDYVSPPRLLSREEVPGGEVSWSLGEYTPGERIWQAFKLPGAPPPVRGTYANQPSPHRGAAGMWNVAMTLVVLVIAGWIFRGSSSHHDVLRQSASFTPDSAAAAAAQGGWVDSAGTPPAPLLTDPFTLRGRTTSLDVELSVYGENLWAGFDVALVRQPDTGARLFDTQVSYYRGVEDGESWSEGSRRSRLRIANVPAGTYRLAVTPVSPFAFEYGVRVRRDRPAATLYLLAILALLIPPALMGLQAYGFERARWMESDHPPVTLETEED